MRENKVIFHMYYNNNCYSNKKWKECIFLSFLQNRKSFLKSSLFQLQTCISPFAFMISITHQYDYDFKFNIYRIVVFLFSHRAE